MKPSDRFDEWHPPRPQHMVPTRYGWMVAHPKHLHLADYVDIGAFTFINAKGGVTIFEDAQIGSHCAIHSSSSIDDKRGEVVIGENARIGSHTTVMPGVTIAGNATVGAHSFVTESVGRGETAYGVPAEVR